MRVLVLLFGFVAILVLASWLVQPLLPTSPLTQERVAAWKDRGGELLSGEHTNAAVVVPTATAIPARPAELAQQPPPPPPPAPAASASAADRAPAPISLPALWVAIVNTGGKGLFLRRTPHWDDKLVAWPEGTKLLIVGPDTDNDGLHWKYVRDPQGNAGWVQADYVTPVSP